MKKKTLKKSDWMYAVTWANWFEDWPKCRLYVQLRLESVKENKHTHKRNQTESPQIHAHAFNRTNTDTMAALQKAKMKKKKRFSLASAAGNRSRFLPLALSASHQCTFQHAHTQNAHRFVHAIKLNSEQIAHTRHNKHSEWEANTEQSKPKNIMHVSVNVEPNISRYERGNDCVFIWLSLFFFA